MILVKIVLMEMNPLVYPVILLQGSSLMESVMNIVQQDIILMKLIQFVYSATQIVMNVPIKETRIVLHVLELDISTRENV